MVVDAWSVSGQPVANLVFRFLGGQRREGVDGLPVKVLQLRPTSPQCKQQRPLLFGGEATDVAVEADANRVAVDQLQSSRFGV